MMLMIKVSEVRQVLLVYLTGAREGSPWLPAVGPTDPTLYGALYRPQHSGLQCPQPRSLLHSVQTRTGELDTGYKTPLIWRPLVTDKSSGQQITMVTLSLLNATIVPYANSLDTDDR